jgi:hypothetical protein
MDAVTKMGDHREAIQLSSHLAGRSMETANSSRRGAAMIGWGNGLAWAVFSVCSVGGLELNLNSE